MRAQANMLALAVALVVLTMGATMSVGLANTAYLSADRDPAERRAAMALSERLVSAETPLTARPNVIEANAVDDLNATALRNQYPVVGERAVRVRLDDRVVASSGDPAGGTTIQRIVLVQRREAVTLTPPLSTTHSTTLPRRSDSARLTIEPPPGVTVTTVRADDRIVLRDTAGLDGTFRIRLSRFETTTLAFEADGDLPTGTVTVTYYPVETRKAILEVTVDG